MVDGEKFSGESVRMALAYGNSNDKQLANDIKNLCRYNYDTDEYEYIGDERRRDEVLSFYTKFLTGDATKLTEKQLYKLFDYLNEIIILKRKTKSNIKLIREMVFNGIGYWDVFEIPIKSGYILVCYDYNRKLQVLEDKSGVISTSEDLYNILGISLRKYMRTIKSYSMYYRKYYSGYLG